MLLHVCVSLTFCGDRYYILRRNNFEIINYETKYSQLKMENYTHMMKINPLSTICNSIATAEL